MEKKSNIWKDAYQEARKRVRGQLGAKGEFVKLLIVIVGTFIAITAFSMFGLMKLFNVNYTVPQIIWYLLGGEIIFVFVLLISEPVVAVFKMFGIINEMFLRLLTTQEQHLQYLYSKEANFLITQEINNSDWVGIRVTNTENRYIEGVIRIESIPESYNFSDSLELKRHGVNGNDTFKLSHNSHSDFDVAIINKGKVVIPYHGGMYSFELSPGIYHLETHLTAKFEDPPQRLINPKIELWQLVYDHKEKPALKLKKISDVASQIKFREIKRKSNKDE